MDNLVETLYRAISTNRISAVEPFNKLLHPRLPVYPILAKNNKCFHCVYVLLFILYILHPPTVSNRYCAGVICWQSSRVLRTVTGSQLLSLYFQFGFCRDPCWAKRAKCNYPLKRHTLFNSLTNTLKPNRGPQGYGFKSVKISREDRGLQCERVHARAKYEYVSVCFRLRMCVCHSEAEGEKGCASPPVNGR